MLRKLPKLFKRSPRPLLLPGEKGIIVMPTSTEPLDVPNLAPPGPPTKSPERNWIVEYTPGPPAIGVLTTEPVAAESADKAHQIIKDRHRWVMIHRVWEKHDDD